MSVSVPLAPSRQLPSIPAPIVTVTDSPRPRLRSMGPQSAHAELQTVSHLSTTTSSPASSTSSVEQSQRPGILRSASTSDTVPAWVPNGGPLNVQFAPLPEIQPRKRRSTRSLGLAARGDMLRAQAERRQQRDVEQDLAWEDLTQLMKDASNLFKRAVGVKSKKKEAAQDAVSPTTEGQAGPSTAEAQAALPPVLEQRQQIPQAPAQQQAQSPSPDHHIARGHTHDSSRAYSPPPLPRVPADDETEGLSDSTEQRESGVSEDQSSQDRPSSTDSDDRSFAREPTPPTPTPVVSDTVLVSILGSRVAPQVIPHAV